MLDIVLLGFPEEYPASIVGLSDLVRSVRLHPGLVVLLVLGNVLVRSMVEGLGEIR